LPDQFSRRSVAIVELTGVHEEIIPSLVDALPEGVHAEVFVNSRCRAIRGDLFEELTGIDATITYVDIAVAADWAALGARIDGGGHDALIISTLQIEGVARWAKQRRTPVIGIVHNPMLFEKSESCKALLKEGGLRVVVLAPHVAARFNAMTKGAYMDRIAVVEPVVWGDPDPMQTPVLDPRHVIVPGGVNFAARDFKGVIDALERGHARRMRDAGIHLQVIGGGPDRAALEQLIADCDLADVIGLLPLGPTGRVPYDAYVAALKRAWAIYPLLPLGWPPYRDHKITSAIPTAVGFSLPVVLDRWTDSAYRVPALITDASIAAALEALIEFDHDARSALCDQIDEYRDRSRKRNSVQIQRFLSL
jgi:hypothetical protein